MSENERMKVCLCYGGKSNEYFVSVSSCKYLFDLLKNDFHIKILFISTKGAPFLESVPNEGKDGRKTDWQSLSREMKGYKIFPITYGQFGEDGRIFSIFDYFGLQYYGGRHDVYAEMFDKLNAKLLSSSFSLHTPNYALFRNGICLYNGINNDESIVIKPRRSGSSLGVSFLHKKDFKEIKNLASSKWIDYEIDSDWLVEEFISGAEIQCGVIYQNGTPLMSNIIELNHDGEIFGVDEKFNKKTTYSIAKLSSYWEERIKKTCLDILMLTGIRDFCRFDFLFDRKEEKLYLLEVSPMFGLAESSAFWYLWGNKMSRIQVAKSLMRSV